jgi:hypothetical protein
MDLLWARKFVVSIVVGFLLLLGHVMVVGEVCSVSFWRETEIRGIQ